VKVVLPGRSISTRVEVSAQAETIQYYRRTLSALPSMKIRSSQLLFESRNADLLSLQLASSIRANRPEPSKGVHRKRLGQWFPTAIKANVTLDWESL